MGKFSNDSVGYNRREVFIESLGLTPKESHILRSIPKAVEAIMEKVGEVKEVERIVYRSKPRLKPLERPIKVTSPDGSTKTYKTKSELTKALKLSRYAVSGLLSTNATKDGMKFEYLDN